MRRGMIGGSAAYAEDEDGSEDGEHGFGKPPSDKRGPGVMGMGRKRAAQAVLDAIESGDAGALDSALAKHMGMCGGGSDETDSDEGKE